jgi:hypothetical protein
VSSEPLNNPIRGQCERAIISYFASPKYAAFSSSKCPNLPPQSLGSCLVINLLKVSPPPTCHACARRWQQPLRKQIVRMNPPKGTIPIRRNSDLWRSRRLIYQTRTCRWPNGQRLASQGNYAFCAYLRIQWEHYHREGTTPVIYSIYLFSVSGPICCCPLCQT